MDNITRSIITTIGLQTMEMEDHIVRMRRGFDRLGVSLVMAMSQIQEAVLLITIPEEVITLTQHREQGQHNQETHQYKTQRLHLLPTAGAIKVRETQNATAEDPVVVEHVVDVLLVNDQKHI